MTKTCPFRSVAALVVVMLLASSVGEARAQQAGGVAAAWDAIRSSRMSFYQRFQLQSLPDLSQLHGGAGVMRVAFLPGWTSKPAFAITVVTGTGESKDGTAVVCEFCAGSPVNLKVSKWETDAAAAARVVKDVQGLIATVHGARRQAGDDEDLIMLERYSAKGGSSFVAFPGATLKPEEKAAFDKCARYAEAVHTGLTDVLER